MPEILLNLTLIKLNKELNNLAKTHPMMTCRAVLRNPSFRQDLVNYILKEIHSNYLLIDSKQDASVISRIVKFTNQERRQVSQLIHQRLCQLRQGNKFCQSQLAGIEELKEQSQDFSTSRHRLEENSLTG